MVPGWPAFLRCWPYRGSCREQRAPLRDTYPVVAAPRHVGIRPAVPKPAVLSVAPLPGSDHISPAGPVLVTATTGTITDVTMRNDAGKMIPGVLTPDNKRMKPTGPLGYGRTYTMTIAAHGPGGMPSRQTSSFTTVSPDYQAEVYRDTVGGTPIQEGGTYGVGTVVARFDEPVDNKANAERHLVVTTQPVHGSWYWLDDQTAHWRPGEVLRPRYFGDR